MDNHISLARELGYDGQELRYFLKKQQDLKGRKGLLKGNIKEINGGRTKR